MGWSYTELVSEERQRRLLAAANFADIVTQINSKMRIISFDVCRGKRGRVKGCSRPEFAFEVGEEAFDLFFNSHHGYRAQYHRSPEHGDRKNAEVIFSMLDKLVGYARDKTPKHPMNIELVKRSLKAKSAKIWINEQGTRTQQGDDVTNVKIYLEVEPWSGTARAYGLAPSVPILTRKSRP